MAACAHKVWSSRGGGAPTDRPTERRRRMQIKCVRARTRSARRGRCGKETFKCIAQRVHISHFETKRALFSLSAECDTSLQEFLMFLATTTTTLQKEKCTLWMQIQFSRTFLYSRALELKLDWCYSHTCSTSELMAKLYKNHHKAGFFRASRDHTAQYIICHAVWNQSFALSWLCAQLSALLGVIHVEQGGWDIFQFSHQYHYLFTLLLRLTSLGDAYMHASADVF